MDLKILNIMYDFKKKKIYNRNSVCVAFKLQTTIIVFALYKRIYTFLLIKIKLSNRMVFVPKTRREFF